ncbi:hypothetical protein RclHR1_00250027 [Rhizophagus clarus]|uniref:Uncharacterized protein n=1 Tax=Rhizophagus clarus TaxID=94130 RepID=A0A2Z6RCC0_9GLOM|nr:hypothetical protein RclHR1_00250027 [Rhizophagus clarus]GET00983.1 hypothetical protein GLOIN_2v136687 [Rhizophagus clarus]
MTSNIIISETQIKEYQDTLNLLTDENCLIYNYALYETNRLMESSIGRPNEVAEDEKVIKFAISAAKCLSDYQWSYYDDSTIAQLEFFLNTMSSVLYIISQSVEMINSDTRTSFYKSLSKFWTTYRNKNEINANVMFKLREIRNCLRKIKDDQSDLDNIVSAGGNVVDVIVNAVQSQYLQALASLTNVLDFEYPAGIWYEGWKEIYETYFDLRQQSSENLENIKKFSKNLIKLSIKEFERVKKKNTTYRNVEYKVLKSGGELLGYSLPDNIDTLLIGYLHLIQRILEEFFPQIKRYIKKIIPLCNEMINTHIKKQLTFKAVEVLYIIKENTQKVEIKNEIEFNFKIWSKVPITSTPMDRSNSDSNLITPDTHEKKPRSLSFPKKVINTLSNSQKEHRQQRNQIIEGVKKLFEERRKIERDINEIKAEYSKLLKNKAINEDSILSELKEILEAKRKRIEYIESLEGKVIDERAFSELKVILEGDKERRDEIGPILSKLKEILDGNDGNGKESSILSKLKEILERTAVEENPTTEKKASNPDNTNDVADVEKEAANDVAEKIKVVNNVKDIKKLGYQNFSGNKIISEKAIVNDTNNVNDARSDVNDLNVVNIVKDLPQHSNFHNFTKGFDGTLHMDNYEVIFDVDEILNDQKYLDDNVIISDERNIIDTKYVKALSRISTNQYNVEEFDDTLYLDNYEIIFDVDEILNHQKYLDDNVIIISDDTIVSDVKDVKALPRISANQYNIEEVDNTLYLDNYEIIFDVDEILNHQKYLDDNMIISDDAIVSNVKDMKVLPRISANQYNIEEFDNTLYLDNYEIIFDVDEILKHQNYLDDVTILVKNANDTKEPLNISNFHYSTQYNYYNFVEEFDDNLCLVNYEMNDEEILPPPPPYSEKDDDALEVLLPSSYDERDMNTLKNMLPRDYNRLDSTTIINVIKENYVINIQQETNMQDNEESSSLLRTFKKIVKEVEILVDKAAKAHQAAVNKEKLRKLSNNSSKPELSEKEKENLNFLYASK